MPIKSKQTIIAFATHKSNQPANLATDLTNPNNSCLCVYLQHLRIQVFPKKTIVILALFETHVFEKCLSVVDVNVISLVLFLVCFTGFIAAKHLFPAV